MKKSFPVILILLLIFCTISRGFCQDESIKNKINTFYDCVEKGDKASFLTILTPEMVKILKEDPKKAGNIGEIYGLLEVIKDGKIKITFKDRDIKIIKELDKSARVRMKFTVTIENVMKKEKDESKSTDYLSLKKNKGKWLIENISNK